MNAFRSLDPRLRASLLALLVLVLLGVVIGGIGGAGEGRQAYRGLDRLAPGEEAARLAEHVERLAAVIEPPAQTEAQPAEKTPEEIAAEIAALEAERDVLRQLRRDLTAVETSEGRTQVFIVDREGGVSGARRPLRIGEEFTDGWQVIAIDATTVTLSNGEETRELKIYALNDS
ncbi:MAG: hypothetical protein V2I43_26125 [Parvularcula sp.]|jgi:hypothetical protein|nr:hypothetical protein [Parvularcula sp.]